MWCKGRHFLSHIYISAFCVSYTMRMHKWKKACVFLFAFNSIPITEQGSFIYRNFVLWNETKLLNKITVQFSFRARLHRKFFYGNKNSAVLILFSSIIYFISLHMCTCLRGRKLLRMNSNLSSCTIPTYEKKIWYNIFVYIKFKYRRF